MALKRPSKMISEFSSKISSTLSKKDKQEKPKNILESDGKIENPAEPALNQGLENNHSASWIEKVAKLEEEVVVLRNMREKELEAERADAVKELSLGMLFVLDELSRIIKVSDEKIDKQAIAAVVSYLDQFIQVNEVQTIDSKEMQKNPTFCKIEYKDDLTISEEIFEEVKKGYTYRNKMIRPAEVTITRNPNREQAKSDMNANN